MEAEGALESGGEARALFTAPGFVAAYRIGAELPGEFTPLRRAPGPGERTVDRQPQILTVHAAILAKLDEYPSGLASI